MAGMMGQQNAAQARGMMDMETRFGIADQQARLQGQQALGQIQSQQLQTAAMRDAAISEADMMYEAERSSRRQALAGTAIGLGTMAAMGSFPGLKGGALQLINMLSGGTPAPGEVAEALPNPFEELHSGRQPEIPRFSAREPRDSFEMQQVGQAIRGATTPSPATSATPATTTARPRTAEPAPVVPPVDEPSPESLSLDPVDDVEIPTETSPEDFVETAQAQGIDINNLSEEELRKLYRDYQTGTMKAIGGFVARSPGAFVRDLGRVDRGFRQGVWNAAQNITGFFGQPGREVEQAGFDAFRRSLDPDFEPFSLSDDFTSDEFNERLRQQTESQIERIRNLFQFNR
jgi:hypothetical protein